jgi:hypothetical protein
MKELKKLHDKNAFKTVSIQTKIDSGTIRIATQPRYLISMGTTLLEEEKRWGEGLKRRTKQD